MADNSNQYGLGDFLVDLVGGDSNLKMNSEASARGMDPSSNAILSQIKDQLNSLENISRPEDDAADGKNQKLGSVVANFRKQQQERKLLESMQMFYTKRFGK